MTKFSYLFWAAFTWLVPFLVANLAMDMTTLTPQAEGIYPESFWTNHIILVVISALATAFSYYMIRRTDELNFNVAHNFLIVNVVLDAIILLWYWQFPAGNWAMINLPTYLIVFYGGVWLFNQFDGEEY